VNVRAHPTVRPFALALGVFLRDGAADKLAFMGPAAQDVAQALLADTLGVLSTFPVRHRVVFSDGNHSVTRETKLPATWREMPQRGTSPGERIRSAFDDLFGLGGEAVLLLSADNPVMPLGALFDGLMWLLPKKRIVIGPADAGGLFAIGAAESFEWLVEAAAGLGLADNEMLKSAGTHLQEDAKARGLEVQMLDPTYHVSDIESFKRLHADVQKGAFAPACRKLFERADIKQHLG
jgi:glycosyltransferase A (GT-A) superfamily protein (DUF2064 family)